MTTDCRCRQVKPETERRRSVSAIPGRSAAATARSPGRTLQEYLGNGGAQRFVGRDIQRAPTVSTPGDPLERQGDIVADQIMHMSAQDVVHRVCKECEDEKEEPIRIHRATSAGSGAGLDVSGAVNAAQRSGAPLPADARSFFEPRFGHDFSAVRVHTGDEASQAARGTNARAYTIGRDIVFGATHS